MSQDQSQEGVAFVSAAVVAEVLDWKPVIDALGAAYAQPHGPATSPLRTVARDGKVWLRSLTAVPPGQRFMGAKVFGVGRKPAVNYLISLFEQASGELRALVITSYSIHYTKLYERASRRPRSRRCDRW